MNLLWTEMESYIQKDLVKPQIKKLYDQAAGNFEKYAELILSSRDLSVIDSNSYEYMLMHIDSIKYEYNFEKMLREVFKDRIQYFDATDRYCIGFALGNENFTVIIDCETSEDDKIAYLVLEDTIESITNYLGDCYSSNTHIVGSFDIYMASCEYENKKQRFDKVLGTLTGDYSVYKCFLTDETPCESLVVFVKYT